MRVLSDMNQWTLLRCRPEFAESSERGPCPDGRTTNAGGLPSTSLVARKEAAGSAHALVPEQTRIPSDPAFKSSHNGARARARARPGDRVSRRKRCTVALTEEEKRLVFAVGASMRAIAEESSDGGRTVRRRVFEGKGVPKVTLEKYLQRMCLYLNNWRHACCAKYGVSAGIRALCMTMIYVDRLCERNPGFQLSRWNVHRLCAIGMLLATKFLEDNMFKNSYWCIAAGIPLQELNQMEMKFCQMLSFDLHVSNAEFDECISLLRRHLQPEISGRLESHTTAV